MNFIEAWKDVALNNDGCSSGPLQYLAKTILNRNYACCCVQHDFSYRYGWWFGETRKDADKELRDCIIASGHTKTGWLVYWAVRSCGWKFYRYETTLEDIKK